MNLSSSFRSGVVLVAFAFIFAGCAASPELKDYSRREIDRPFTLPKELSTWSTVGYLEQESGKYSDGTRFKDTSSWPVNPLVWQQSLSDRWTLIWAPIPVGAMYQIRSDSSVRSGLVLGYGLGISSDSEDSYAELSVNYSHLQKLNESFGLEFTPTISPLIPFGNGRKFSVQAQVGAGPLWQVANTLALRGGVKTALRRYRTFGFSGSFADDSFEFHVGEKYRVAFPLYGGFVWSLSRRWDLLGNYQYERLGERNDFSSHSYAYELKYYF